MLSRVANSIHWMCRYLERAENTARFIDVNLQLLLDLPSNTEEQWMPLVNVTGDHKPFLERYGNPSKANVLQFLVFDRENPNSMASCVYRARESARTVREAISSEMWEQVNRSYLMLQEAQKTGRLEEEAAAFLSHFKKACHLFTGITDVTMTHGEGWHFAQLGFHMERADKTSRILDVKYFILLPRPDYVGTPYDSLQWGALLRSASAFEMYRKRYRQISPQNVTSFLILDREFPRSIQFCLARAEADLHAITATPIGAFANAAEQKLGRLRSELDYTDIEEIFQTGLHEYLDSFQAKLNGVGAAIHDTFFAVATPQRPSVGSPNP